MVRRCLAAPLPLACLTTATMPVFRLPLSLLRWSLVLFLALAGSGCAWMPAWVPRWPAGADEAERRPVVRPAPEASRIGGDCGPRDPITYVPPKPPAAAVQAGVGGWVVLSFDAMGDGLPLNLRVLDSSPPGMFDQAALEAVSHWRFASGLVGSDCRTLVTFPQGH